MRYIKILLLLFIVQVANAQNKRISQVITLQMSNDMGTRSSSVVWHPTQKKYYVAKCGNASFSMRVFDVNGGRLSPLDLKVGEDVRGVWYNSNTKKIEFNAYGNAGYGEFTLDNKGLTNEAFVVTSGTFQPNTNAVGVYDAKNNQVHFLNAHNIVTYDRTTLKEVKTMRVYFDARDEEDYLLNGIPKSFSETPSHINYTSVIYTGIENAEFGFLNTKSNKIDLYNAKTGFLTQSLMLPDSAPLNNSFSFSYANGIYFLYDAGNHKWIGYQ